MNTLRLLFVIPFYKPAYVYGGPVRSLSTLASALAGKGCQVSVYTTNANGRENFDPSLPETQSVDGVEVHYFHRALPGSFYYSPALARACTRNTPLFDLVYIYSTWAYPFLPAASAARRHAVPMVVSPRTSFMHETWQNGFAKKWLYHHLAERALLNSASAIHYTTKLEEEKSAWLHLAPPAFTAPNPVNLAEFKHLPAREIFRQRHHIAESETLLLYLGRIEPRKGLPFALRTFANLVARHPGCRFAIAGPDEDNHTHELQHLVRELGLEKKVTFTGYLDPAQRLEALAASDLFMLTSHSENFGMAVVEALACGLPVFISDRVGIADQVTRCQAGEVTPLDATTATDRLISMVERLPGRRGQLHQNALDAARVYSSDQVAGSMLPILQGLASGHLTTK